MLCYKGGMRAKTAFASVCALALFLAALPGEASEYTDEAQRLYREKSAAVFQIRVVDLATGKKSALGSGFRIGGEGQVATNFHVVEEAVHYPDRFRVEALRDGTVAGELEILGIDVVHDLALAYSPALGVPALPLGASDLSKGTRIFSLGNPYDLGMTIMEGTYNGLMERSLYRKILFSGSLNPGMSGGPALNRDGQVLGVNVSTAGNEVSFLVPVEYLADLIASAGGRSGPPAEGWDGEVERQIVANQNHYMEEILSGKWDTLTVGKATVPGEIHEVVKCWSETHDEEHELYRHADVYCSNEEEISISATLATGWISYNYRWITSGDLSLPRFYSLYETFYESSLGYSNAEEEDVTNFTCKEGFVDLAGLSWKTALCARSYKSYPKLFDFHMIMASVGGEKEGFVVEAQLLGIGEENALAFARKVMEGIAWKER